MKGLIETNSIDEGWLKSLQLFDDPIRLNRYDSMRGPCIEFEELVLKIKKPNVKFAIPPHYPIEFRSLIERYTDGFLGNPGAEKSTVSERLYRWPIKQNTILLNQISMVTKTLKSKPESRYNIVGFWDPERDPQLKNPVSPLLAYFRVRSEHLHATLTVRSVDAWLGALPMFIGFARLHQKLADDTENRLGTITFFILSYHVYEMDLPVVQNISQSMGTN